MSKRTTITTEELELQLKIPKNSLKDKTNEEISLILLQHIIKNNK